MRVLGFSPSYSTAHWTLVDGQGDRQDPDALTVAIERSGFCRLRDLPAEVGGLVPPDHVIVPPPPTDRLAAGHWVGAFRIRRFCRRQEGWPAPCMLTGTETYEALIGGPESYDAFLADPGPFQQDMAESFITLLVRLAVALNESFTPTPPKRSRSIAAQGAVIFMLTEHAVTYSPELDNVTIVPEPGAR